MPIPPPSVSQTTKYAAFWEGPRRAYLHNHAGGHQPILEHANEPGAAEYDDRYDSNLDNEIHYQPEKVG
eukprot:CAMPEP_0119473132 /NCGR_PEP_ID=MMETSP1344-20130328/4907_1 /TAXON_ID=236787 /ORGANISM="Florenciella parvula, Strain CCMP2471" /LENGTH=68 /DNA_ID=CAMNT_0007506187 /DNA_START=585 /DNA_END=792 /DNA_ORIENTATION=+